MATLDDSALDRLRELNSLRDHAKDLRDRGLQALARIPQGFTAEKYEKLQKDYDLSSDEWVCGPHPIDVALLVRVLNRKDLDDVQRDPPNQLSETLASAVTRLFSEVTNDAIPVLTAARSLHALVTRPETVFSTATMLCYYRVIRELYFAAFPNWIIGAARAGEGGRVSAFVTGESIRAILAFRGAIRDSITFFKTTRKLLQELERLEAFPDVDAYLKVDSTNCESPWRKCLDIEAQRVILDWYAANNLRRNVIALNFSDSDMSSDVNRHPAKGSFKKNASQHNGKPPKTREHSLIPSLFPLAGAEEVSRATVQKFLARLPNLLRVSIERARKNIAQAKDLIEQFRAREAGLLQSSDIKDLDFFANRLTADLKKYKHYADALSQETKDALNAYLKRRSKRAVQSNGSANDGNAFVEYARLKESVVRELNEKFKKQFVASSDDWQELRRRVKKNAIPKKRFSKDTEWLVERHLAIIKLSVKKVHLPVYGSSELIQLNRLFLEEAFSDETTCAFNQIDRRHFDATLSAHDLAFRTIKEALDEAIAAKAEMDELGADPDLTHVLNRFNEQYLRIYERIERVTEPAKHYIQDVLNRELARAANSAKFDAGELLFAATCFGALTGWKQHEQLAEARRLLTKILPEDGRLQTSRPFQSTPQGQRLIPIAFEMTRCLAQLLQKDFTEDLDPKLVQKILYAFDEQPITFWRDQDGRIGWNFRGAPESQKPSVWVTAIAVFALGRTVKMLNERINAMVLKHFNVEWPNTEAEPPATLKAPSGNKLDLNGLIYPDYELQSCFSPSAGYDKEYEEDPARVDRVSVAVRLQQMRAHLTRAVLPDVYSKKKAYSAIFYGPPGTGKTTLAEALATTANVPLVRLSPSDLMVQGTDVIESRARAIFDSLSMLTKVVIFLDEFEPVVRSRAEILQDTNAVSDPPEFRFLVTGMLPKLIKLNKTSESQAVVYCLATNYLTQVDKAAKRVGRFDLQIPIYHPDPMSRVGVFLFRLIAILQSKEKEDKRSWREHLQELQRDPEFWHRTHEAIAKTMEVSAQSLATIFFSARAANSFFKYVLQEVPKCPLPTPEKGRTDKSTVEKDIEKQRTQFEEDWKSRGLQPAPEPSTPRDRKVKAMSVGRRVRI
jgi:hypothetical protein